MVRFTDIVKEVVVSEHMERAMVIDQDQVRVQFSAAVHHVEGDVLYASVITSAVVFTVVASGGIVIKFIGVFSTVALAGVSSVTMCMIRMVLADFSGFCSGPAAFIFSASSSVYGNSLA